NSPLQFFSSIAARNGTTALCNDRALVVVVVDKMNRASRELNAVLDGRSVNSQSIKAMAAEGWNQGGVDVNDSIGKVVGDGQQLEIASHHDQLHVMLTTQSENRLAMRLWVGKVLPRNDLCRNRCLFRVTQSTRLGATADDQSKFDG